jgi:hypothetical protein
MGKHLVQISGINEPDYDDDDYVLDDEDNWEMDCGQFVDDGIIYCQKAGSEECDWDCPHRDELGEEIEEEDDDEE